MGGLTLGPSPEERDDCLASEIQKPPNKFVAYFLKFGKRQTSL
jgi:hypothetical protein